MPSEHVISTPGRTFSLPFAALDTPTYPLLVLWSVIAINFMSFSTALFTI
jgi:hypothetical protein